MIENITNNNLIYNIWTSWSKQICKVFYILKFILLKSPLTQHSFLLKWIGIILTQVIITYNTWREHKLIIFLFYIHFRASLNWTRHRTKQFMLQSLFTIKHTITSGFLVDVPQMVSKYATKILKKVQRSKKCRKK